MVRVLLDISDPTTKLTLTAVLQKEGCLPVSGGAADVVIADDARRAVAYAKSTPALLVAPMGRIAEAVGAMRKGVYGYIFLPLQPGEAALMVQRAAANRVADEPAADTTTVDQAEAQLIMATLRKCKYNKTKAAKALGIGRNTLWRKLKKIDSGLNS